MSEIKHGMGKEEMANEVTSHAGAVMNALRKVERETADAIRRMNEGQTASCLMDGSVYGRSANDVDLASAKLQVTLNMAMWVLNKGEIQDAYQKGVERGW